LQPNNHSVELGEYHLSKVRFPGKVTDQSRLSISELVLRSLGIGLNAARANGRWTSEDLANMSFNFAIFGLLGVMNSVFYQMQAHWFGSSRSPGVLAAKTLVDQFVYTPFLSNPMQTLAFLWKSEQFSFRRMGEKMRQFRQFYVLTVLPVLVSNWLFWIPMVVLIYCFPTLAPIAPGNIGVCYLEHVTHSLS
jgi:hypothetical protein